MTSENRTTTLRADEGVRFKNLATECDSAFVDISDDQHTVVLGPEEAHALRDWLTKVIR